jgi:tape measure domain-containing protein
MPNVPFSLQIQQNISAELRAIATDTRALSAASVTMARTFQGALDTNTQALSRLGAELRTVQTHTQKTGSVFAGVFGGNLVSQVIGKVTGGITDLGKASLDLVGNLESNTAALTSMAGSADAAQKQLATFRQFASKTAFNTDDVIKYAVQLEGVGVTGTKVVPTLRDIADALAGVGRGADPQKLQQVTDAYLKVQTQGKAQTEELLQFADAGIPIFDVLAQALGKTSAQISDMAQKGELTAQVFDRAFDVGVQARWQGAAEKSSQTLQGIISNAQDVGTQFLTVLGKAAVESSGLEQRLQGVVNYLNNPEALEAVKRLGAELGSAAAHVFDMLGWLGQVLGLPPLEIPPPPDFSQAKTDVAAIGQGVAGWSEPATDFSKEIGHAQHEMDGLRRQEQAEAAAATNRTNAIRDATTQQDRIYDDQLTKLRAQGDALDRQYQIQQQQRNLARQSTKIGQDQLLALDISSNAGQGAAERLPDELNALADLQGQIRQDAAKADIKANEDAVQANKTRYDRQQQDAQTAIERQQEAQRQANAAAIQGWQDQIDAYKRLQDALAKPDPRIKATSDEYRAAYDSTFQGIQDTGTQTTTDTISAQTALYQQFYGHTLPDAAGAARPGLFAALWGTDTEQQAWGTTLTQNVLTGISAETDAWSKGHGSDLMNALMGGKNFQDAFNNWAGQVGGVEQAGGDVARGVRQAAGLDTPDKNYGAASYPGTTAGVPDSARSGVGKGPNSNDTRMAGNPNAAANLTDPDTYNPLSPNNPLTGGIGRALGDIWNNVTGGGRASGGSVYAGMTYPVNEPQLGGRPEYFTPAMDGYISNTAPMAGGGGGTTIVNHINLTIAAPGTQDRDYWRGVAQTISQELAGYMRVRG